MQPNDEGEDADHHGGGDHRAIAEQRLAGECGDDLRKDAERRQNQDVDLGMTPHPEQVHVHHRIALAIDREEVKAEVTVEQEHREGGGQDRESRDHQQVRGKRGPAEDRHAHVPHSGRTRFENRGDEIYSGQQRADAGDLQCPEVVVDAHPGRELQLAERRICDPAGLCKLTDRQRDVGQEDARSGQPQGHRVQGRKGHVAHAELQRHDEVHQADHERHGHEEDHDRAVRRKDLVEVLRRQVALRAAGRDRLLRAHHDRIGEAAKQHDEREHAIHHADALMIDGGDPLAPQIRDVSLRGDPRKNEHDGQHHPRGRAHDDGLIERDRVPVQLAKEVHCSDLNEWVGCDGSSDGDPELTIWLKRSRATAR